MKSNYSKWTTGRTLINLLGFGLLGLLWLWQTHHTKRAEYSPIPTSFLKQQFDEANEQYFLGMLPHDTTVSYDTLTPDSIAITTKDSKGKFHITFNPEFRLGQRFSILVLLHESCHVQTWNEKGEHGKRWHGCMLRLYNEGAFQQQLMEGMDN